MKKKNKVITKIPATVCPNCMCALYSRAEHDYISCFCGGISVDGGYSNRYGRRSWDPDKVDPTKIFGMVLEVEATPFEIFNDWNKRIDKLGRVFVGKKAEWGKGRKKIKL